MQRRSGGERLIDGADLARFLTETAPDPEPEPVVVESARNRFPGIVTKVEKEGLVAVVHIQAGPHRVVSLMTRRGRRRARARARRPRGRGREVHQRRRGSPTARVTAITSEQRSREFVRRFALVDGRASRCVAHSSVDRGGRRTRREDEGDQARRARSPCRRRRRSPRCSPRWAPTSRRCNKGTTITFNFAASSALATQIQGGAPADVFASADGAEHAEARDERSGDRRSGRLHRRTSSRSS